VDAYNTISMNSNKITDLGTPTATTDAATKGYVDTQLSSSSHNITFVGDDSTGTAVTQGEAFKFAGTQNITTAVSGDTLTITGPDLSSYLTDNGLGDLTVTGSTISSPSNADLTLTSSAGSVVIEGVEITGTIIKTTDSSNLRLQGAIIEVDGQITATKMITGGSISSPDATFGSLSLSDNKVRTNTTNADLELEASGTGQVVTNSALKINKGYIEAINTLTSSSTITVDFAEASVHTVTLAENTEFVVTNLPTGATGTIIITQDGGGSNTGSFGTDGSTAVKFAGGTPTLSTAGNAIDVVTIFNDGTNYLGNIAKAYAA
jgi:hypothetical protein